MSGSELTVGQQVLFVPGTDHALDRHHGGGFLYELYDADGHAVTAPADLKKLRREGGVLTLNKKPVTFAGRPKEFWRAVVVAVRPGGAACDLDVTDGTTGARLHYRDRKYDPDGKKPDTFHLEEDGE